MSVPKNLAKRQKLARKRQRKQQSRLKHRKQSALPTESFQAEPLEEKFPQSLAEKFPGGIVHVGAVGNIKTSDVLDDFVKPFADLIEDADAYRRLLTLGMLAWNAALEPEWRQQQMVDDVIGKGLAAETQWVQMNCRQIVNQLVERKRKYFAQYKRPILNFMLQDTGDGYHLTVISAVV